jgi:ELWxxDGT repeat protein
MVRAGLVAVSLMIFGWALPGAAQPSLVKDIAQGAVDLQRDGASLSGFTPVGPRAVLVIGRSDEAGSINELWTTDGTDAGTERLQTFLNRDVQVVGSNGRIAFVLVSQREFYPLISSILWRTDGTPAGTYAVIQTPLTFFSNPVIHRGALVFSACPGTTTIGCGEPWVSDGTAGGTRRLRDITPGDYGSDPREFVSVGDLLYFFATAPDGPGLWQTDLTRPGTRRVALLPPYSVPHDLKAAGERLFFIVGQENSLWTSDGTAEGTRPVPPFDRPRGRGPSALLLLGAVGESEFFTGLDPALGVQVYSTDGTPGGTRRLTSFPRTEPEKGEVTEAAALPDRLFFVGLDGQLWSSAGTRASTRPLAGCTGGCPVPFFGFRGFSRTAAGGLLYFAGKAGDDAEPWVTDGTAAGTRRLLEICADGSCGTDTLFGPAFRGRVLFAAAQDLWSTDGTAAGTRRVGEGVQVPDQGPLPAAAAGSRVVFAGFDKSGLPTAPIPQLKSSAGTLRSELVLGLSLRDGLGSDPRSFTALGDGAIFFDCTPSAGGVWKTRGTPETTVRLTDSAGSCGSFATAGGVAYFTAIRPGDYWGELWRTDGTPAGTSQVSHVGPESFVQVFAPLQGRLYFVAETEADNGHLERSTLWSTDGTAAGTEPLFDLPDTYVADLRSFGDRLYFHGERLESSEDFLLESDGTEAGTRELFPSSGFNPTHFLRFGGQTFIVDDGSLWKTDGTAEGTRQVTDPAGPIQGALDLAALGDRIYFMAHLITDPNNTLGTPALFRTDGTQAATVLVRTFALDPTLDEAPDPQFTTLDGALFFVAADPEHGSELWRTDGTAAGTALVIDLNPGPDSALISGLTAVNGRLYFAADDGEHGIELWTSDGTAAGTRRVSDIAPGPYSSSPRELSAIGGLLYFSADDQVIGREPWVLPLDGEGKP